jgi:hypothetical protein
MKISHVTTPTRFFFLLLVLLVLIQAACVPGLPQPAAPGTDTPPPSAAPVSTSLPGSAVTALPNQDSSNLLAAPETGLSALTSYRAVFDQKLSGALDGKMVERTLHLEFRRAAGREELLREIKMTGMPDALLQVLKENEIFYVIDGPGQPCSGSVEENLPWEGAQPAALLLPVQSAQKVGSEQVNGMNAVHYRLDPKGLGLEDSAAAATVDLWIAAAGGYVVKYTLSIIPPASATESAQQSWQYELTQVNALPALDLPAGCQSVLMEIPAVPDAQNIQRSAGVLQYTTVLDAGQVGAFYRQQLLAQGWAEQKQPEPADPQDALTLGYQQGSRKVMFMLEKASPGLSVTAFLIDMAAASLPAAPGSPTPRPEATINPAKSGLPEDVPLYPGATGLTAAGGNKLIKFQTTDKPETVAKFYRERLAGAGWTGQPEQVVETRLIQQWTKAGRLIVMIIASKDGITDISFSFMK